MDSFSAIKKLQFSFLKKVLGQKKIFTPRGVSFFNPLVSGPGRFELWKKTEGRKSRWTDPLRKCTTLTIKRPTIFSLPRLGEYISRYYKFSMWLSIVQIRKQILQIRLMTIICFVEKDFDYISFPFLERKKEKDTL